ncbi:MAG: hypothetical protein ABI142_08885 [Bryocella sp.]
MGALAMGQPLPKAMTLTDLTGSLVITQPLALVGSTVTVQAHLYTNIGGVAAPVGADCTFSPQLTGVVGVGTTGTCTASGLSITLAAGTQVFWVVDASATGGLQVNSVSLYVSLGAAMQ